MNENLSMTGKPYLNVAAICERHIQEADGAVTLFRIVDRFAVGGTTEEFPPGVILKFEIVVCFRSGSYRGRLDLTLTSIDPDVTVLSATTNEPATSMATFS